MHTDRQTERQTDRHDHFLLMQIVGNLVKAVNAKIVSI